MKSGCGIAAEPYCVRKSRHIYRPSFSLMFRRHRQSRRDWCAGVRPALVIAHENIFSGWRIEEVISHGAHPRRAFYMRSERRLLAHRRNHSSYVASELFRFGHFLPAVRCSNYWRALRDVSIRKPADEASGRLSEKWRSALLFHEMMPEFYHQTHLPDKDDFRRALAQLRPTISASIAEPSSH